MFGLGTTELLVILAIALIVLGPQKLPGLASSLGKAIRSFRKATRELSSQLEIEEDVRRPFQELHAALRDEAPVRPMPPPSVTPAAIGQGAPTRPGASATSEAVAPAAAEAVAPAAAAAPAAPVPAAAEAVPAPSDKPKA